MSAPFNTDHAFQSDGETPYCAKCELLSWMHSTPPKETLMTTNHEDLIAEARREAPFTAWAQDAALIDRLADALESTTARLREVEREAEAETARLRALSRRWQEVTNAPGFVQAVEAEARAYHDSACIYQERLREAEACIEEIRANAVELLDADDDSYDGSLSATWVVERLSRYKPTTENGSER